MEDSTNSRVMLNSDVSFYRNNTTLQPSFEVETNYTNNASDPGNFTQPPGWITANISLDLNTSDPADEGNTSQVLARTSQILDSLKSTFMTEIANFNNTTVPITGDNDLSVLSTPVPVENPRFSSMEIWFIATGSVILAVIVLFCINTCIQCQLFEKISKKFKRRNQMVELEKRCHKDRDLMFGGHHENINTHTHMFLHVHPRNH